MVTRAYLPLVGAAVPLRPIKDLSMTILIVNLYVPNPNSTSVEIVRLVRTHTDLGDPFNRLRSIEHMDRGER